MKKTYLFVSFIFIAFLVIGYTYYKDAQSNISQSIVKSNETILNVDKIRFIFKTGCMSRRALNAVFSAKTFKDENYIDEAIEYCEAAIAYAQMNYTKDEELLNFVVPKLENAIAIIETNGLNIDDTNIKILKKSFDEINRFAENKEKNVWANIQQNYINFRTHEVEKINLYETIILISTLLLLTILLSYFFKEKAKKKEQILIEKLNYAADEALNGYWEWHLDTNYMYMSKGWKKFLGYEENELENDFKTFENRLHPDDFESTQNRIKQYLKNKKGTYNNKFRLKHKNGSSKWVSSVGAVQENDTNIFFGFHIDIDDLTTTKETLIAQSKSAMMGEMVGAIAHQIKQPMSVISMLSSNQLASVELEEEITPEMIQKDANENLKQILYLSETIDTFKNFLKPDSVKTNTTIESVIDSSLNILDKSLKNNSVEIIKHYSHTQEIKVYNSELMQVFINLLTNSKDAFRINSIDTRIINITTLEKENNIIIKLEDTAGGIPEDKIGNIFDAYFTTKEDDGGTGLGLYIVKTIIEEHYNGTINVNNTEKGVIFIINLPLS